MYTARMRTVCTHSLEKSNNNKHHKSLQRKDGAWVSSALRKKSKPRPARSELDLFALWRDDAGLLMLQRP
jgi:hypothetical protein